MVQFGVEEEDREVLVEELLAVVADLGIAGEEGEVGEAPEEAAVVEAADSVQTEVGDEVEIQILREQEDQVEGEVRDPGARRYGAITKKWLASFIQQLRFVKICWEYIHMANDFSKVLILDFLSVSCKEETRGTPSSSTCWNWCALPYH